MTVPRTLLSLLDNLTPGVGVTRLGDITGLDEIGLPVYQAIRPGAEENGLCVHSGKGLSPAAARVSALMEACEHHWSEGRHHLGEIVTFPPGHAGVSMIRSLVPYTGRAVDDDLPYSWTRCWSLSDEDEVWLPAEVVFHPLNGQERYYFGTETRGLAAGTTVAAALLHGLLEVIEHDARTIAHLCRRATRMPAGMRLAPDSAALIERADRAGLDCHLAFLPSDVGTPVVACTLIERGASDPLRMNHGYCAALTLDNAVIGALTEAIQSRLGLIAGSRDDFPERARKVGRWASMDDRRRYFAHLLEPEGTTTAVHEPDRDHVAGSAEERLAGLVERVRAVTGHAVYWRELNPPGWPVHIVRVIGPEMQPKIEYRPRLSRRALEHVSWSRR